MLWLGIMAAADKAEARGDAAAALDVITRHPVGPDGKPFWRPWRVRRLLEVVDAGPHLPRWATSRWVVAQCLQFLDDSNRGRSARAREVAVALRGGLDRLPGVDEIDAQCRVMDHDWVYRQLFVYDLGGLHAFIRAGATADLLAGADDLHAWAKAPMSGYRLVRGGDDEVTWEDLSDGTLMVLPNLGSQLPMEAGQCVIGRAVPTADGSLFEAVPLPVPESVAKEVACDPHGWLDAVRRGVSRFGIGAIDRADSSAARVLLEGLDLHCLLDDGCYVEVR